MSNEANGNFSMTFSTDETIEEQIEAIIPTEIPKEKSVEVLIGPSGSGKTTYALRMKQNDPSIVVLSSDESTKISERWAFIKRELNYKKDFAALISTVKQKTTKYLQSILHVLCTTDRNIIIDRTNMSAKERSNFIRIAKVYGYTVIAHEMQISRELAYKRSRARRYHPTLKQNKINFALNDQFKRHEKAVAEEGFNKIKVTMQH